MKKQIQKEFRRESQRGVSSVEAVEMIPLRKKNLAPSAPIIEKRNKMIDCEWSIETNSALGQAMLTCMVGFEKYSYDPETNLIYDGAGNEIENIQMPDPSMINNYTRVYQSMKPDYRRDPRRNRIYINGYDIEYRNGKHTDRSGRRHFGIPPPDATYF